MLWSLKKALTARNVTQKELSAAIGITERSMSMKIQGHREFTRSEMLAASKYLKSTLDELFGEDK